MWKRPGGKYLVEKRPRGRKTAVEKTGVEKTGVETTGGEKTGGKRPGGGKYRSRYFTHKLY